MIWWRLETNLQQGAGGNVTQTPGPSLIVTLWTSSVISARHTKNHRLKVSKSALIRITMEIKEVCPMSKLFIRRCLGSWVNGQPRQILIIATNRNINLNISARSQCQMSDSNCFTLISLSGGDLQFLPYLIQMFLVK